MFDVIWTDPNVELVGQRMLRKEQEAKEKDKKRAESIRQSVSTNSSSCPSERGFSLFAGKGRKKGSTSSRGKTNSCAQSHEEPECTDAKARRNSTYGVKAALNNQDESGVPAKPSNGPFVPVQSPEIEGTRSPLPIRDSALSNWAHQAAVATGVFEKIVANETDLETKTEEYVQTIGPSSFITQTIQTTISPRAEGDNIDQHIIETQISSDGIRIQDPPLADVPEEPTPRACEESESFPPPYNFPRTPPPMDRQKNQIASSPGYRSRGLLGDPEAWKPPHEWDCTPTKQSTTSTITESLETTQAAQNTSNSILPALPVLQRELRMMAAASSELMLANLKSGMGEATDAIVYKELEMTKKRWMFSALHRQDGYAQLMERPNEYSENPAGPKQTRILALYETPTSASFLAALYPAASITHLSPHPLSPDLFPSVHPLLVPSVSVSAGSRALPPRLYSAVTCLTMPALFPSTDIPPLLRHINRCLAPGGALHLTIIDPQPVSASMGPKLRQWLFTNLLINLEQTFRTTWPSETFPAWLAVGRLRGKGSTIATKTIPAIPIIAKSPSKEDLKAELRCLSNRLLWQEVWGGFVQASQWWWEDKEIVQECLGLGTHWQCSHIIAVKEDPIKSSRSIR